MSALGRPARLPRLHDIRRRSDDLTWSLEPEAVLGPLFWGWFRARTREQADWFYPSGPAEVGIPGREAIRVLLIGDAPAAGFGVRIHELGMAGHLAREIARRSGRGVVVTVSAEPDASAESTLKRLVRMDLGRYDVLILMLTTTDAFCLTTRASWRRSMSGLVRALEASGAPSIFVTGAASMHLARTLTPFARRLTGRHARMLDLETASVCQRSTAQLVRLDAASDLTPRTYARWSRRLGERIADGLAGEGERLV